jgi:FkbM family methyltransferase
MRPIAILRSAIRRWLAERFDFPEIPRALTRLRAQGFVPEIVFDIGAYRGDFARACLATWPQTRIVCFEPLPQTQSVLQELARQDPRVSVHETLLGAKTLPRVKFYNGETESSVLLEKAIPQRNFIMCHQTTIDAVVCDSKVTPDFLRG